ncbi:SDR family oxidoreductase [uncultured Amnibacterium sp.]|uniref:SDR family oxidoreductase n=1 Tax=uncultured Amnibacterium sp. TaxID=1631851 RepID=UPI0035C987B1
MTIASDAADGSRKRVLITGSSRGIGADTARTLAGAGARIVVNYREKARRADALVAEIASSGGTAVAIGADLTDPSSAQAMLEQIRTDWGGLDVLVLNASGGMESGMAEDYALRLNRDAQVGLVRAALPLLGPGSRIVFVTSHQAHFIATTPTMPQYEPVARSKRAGEDALRALIPELTAAGVEFVVVSGDMIEGTITVKLLERANPGVIAHRRESAGRLYSVAEFAAEVARAVDEPVPESHTRFVGDVADFTPVAGE